MDLFRSFTDFLLGQADTNLDFDCFPTISNTLPVTITDFEGNTVVDLFNMRAGIDRNSHFELKLLI